MIVLESEDAVQNSQPLSGGFRKGIATTGSDEKLVQAKGMYNTTRVKTNGSDN